jgi:uncharacterized membrane protein (DUF2068 family)
MSTPSTLFWISSAIFLMADGIIRLAAARGMPWTSKAFPALEALIGLSIFAVLEV